MVKKILTVILSAALCAGLVFPAAACKDTPDSGNSQGTKQVIPDDNQFSSGEQEKPEGQKDTERLKYVYDFESCGYVVAGIGNNAFTEIVIPASYNGKPVTAIGYEAFEGCTSLTSVTIPDSVTSIGAKAFEDTAYYKNKGNWVSGVLYIGNHLIKAKETISGDHTIKSGTKTIANGAFKDCSFLTSITIPDSVTSIGLLAFDDTAYYNNKDNWERGVLYIGNHLIEAEHTLSGDHTIKSGTKTIAGSAFSGCASLKSITIPDSVTTIEDGAFESCTSFTNITIPNSVKTIGDDSFKDCTSLKSITIPGSVTSIGMRASKDAHRLRALRFPIA